MDGGWWTAAVKHTTTLFEKEGKAGKRTYERSRANQIHVRFETEQTLDFYLLGKNRSFSKEIQVFNFFTENLLLILNKYLHFFQRAIIIHLTQLRLP